MGFRQLPLECSSYDTPPNTVGQCSREETPTKNQVQHCDLQQFDLCQSLYPSTIVHLSEIEFVGWTSSLKAKQNKEACIFDQSRVKAMVFMSSINSKSELPHQMCYTQEAVSFLFLFDDTNAKNIRQSKSYREKKEILCQLRTKLFKVAQLVTVLKRKPLMVQNSANVKLVVYHICNRQE